MFWDESGVSLLPVTRRTWAPRGVTPVIRHHFKWKRASMAAGLCYGSRGGGAKLAFHRSPDAYNTAVDTYKNPLVGLMEVGLVAAVLFHALNGIRVVLVDFW